MNWLAEVLAREVIMEKQRARVDWLWAGDWNTTFFHAKAKQHARTNRVVHLRRSNGSLCSDLKEIEQMAISFYKGLFTAQDSTTPAFVTQFVPRKVTYSMNVDLSTPFSSEEVQTALFMMHPNKAPGPDGFTMIFFQSHCQHIKEDVSKAVLQFLNDGEMPDILNNTVLTLIPKVKNPQDLTNFRSIALFNVLYKICSKAIANRLR
jgi:hypothetical protein